MGIQVDEDRAEQMIGRNKPPDPPQQTERMGFDDFAMRLGDVMRGERATLGKSLLDVQRELKIKANYIAAIENADARAFETPGFIAGYVRSYARFLGMDPEWTFETFCRESGFRPVNGLEFDKAVTSRSVQRTPQPQAKPVQKQSAFGNSSVFGPKPETMFSRIEPGAVGSSLVLLALLGAISYGGWAVLREIQQVQLAPVDQAPGVLASVDPLAQSSDFSQRDTAPGQPVGTSDALDRMYRPQVLDIPVMIARDGPIAAIDPGLVGALAPGNSALEPVGFTLATVDTDIAPVVATQAVPQDVSAPKVLADAAPEVMLVAVREAWVRVRSADGSVLLEKTLQPGDTYVLPQTEAAATLRAGAASSVFFMINGLTYGPAGGRGQVVDKIVLSAEALSQKFAQADVEANDDAKQAVRVAQAALTLQKDQ
ncbi:MAG: cytoskeleton protein RodZ [Paracoccaceae bacterium]